MYSRERNLIPEILTKAYETCIKPYLHTDIGVCEKGKNDIVTLCDMKSQNYIVEQLRSLFPMDCILAEENLSDKDALSKGQRTWVIDPIDGTVNFASGVPIYGIQLALTEGTEPVFAALFLPEFGKMYLAEKDRGATMNGEPIHTGTVTNTAESIVSFGDFSPANPKIRAAQRADIAKLSENILRLRMFGSSCYDFVSLASGHTQAHIMYSKTMWDILPGWLLAKEAGAVSSFDPENPKSPIVCAATEEILDDILKLLNKSL